MQNQDNILLKIEPHGKEQTVTIYLVGKSKPLREIVSLIPLVAEVSSSPVLITGPSGSGKEIIAKAIHYDFRNPRRNNAFHHLNCAAIPGELVESELFGYERGAFTGANYKKAGLLESVREGTLFLDEIGDMLPYTQAKLLAALQKGGHFKRLGSSNGDPIHFKGRVIAATNHDLDELVSKGRFNEALYHRLNALRMEVPALKERTEDIEPLILHYLHLGCEEQERVVPVIDGGVIDLLKSHRVFVSVWSAA
ncbi:sigma-54-dependent Fis family transcriptional regulator [Candidatus Woesearchaeota archaeon]|nr:sigma-54-dependent Fis family transcriptional regulator [Candidatus Woesearchaeota archaeon]